MNNIIPTLRYIWLTLCHKWFVFRAGLRTGAPIWNLLVHDLSKFGPSEAPHYGRQFFGDKSRDVEFAAAWNHHQKANKHHWEYWVMCTGHNRGGYGDGSILPMPVRYIREMVADWLGASRAYEGTWVTLLETWNWFDSNFLTGKVRLHPTSKAECFRLLQKLFPGEIVEAVNCPSAYIGPVNFEHTPVFGAAIRVTFDGFDEERHRVYIKVESSYFIVTLRRSRWFLVK